jgi:hypothetical protein
LIRIRASSININAPTDSLQVLPRLRALKYALIELRPCDRDLFSIEERPKINAAVTERAVRIATSHSEADL